jgi:hypothetical protein
VRCPPCCSFSSSQPGPSTPATVNIIHYHSNSCCHLIYDNYNKVEKTKKRTRYCQELHATRFNRTERRWRTCRCDAVCSVLEGNSEPLLGSKSIRRPCRHCASTQGPRRIPGILPVLHRLECSPGHNASRQDRSAGLVRDAGMLSNLTLFML